MNLEKLFNPKSIAILGASEEDGKVGNVLAKNILTLGYQGEVFLVNPKYDSLFGRRCYKKIDEIESEIDLAVLAIPAKFVNDEIKNNAEKVKNYVVISAGFSETSEEGKKREEELKKIAKEGEINVLGPNCLGFIVPEFRLNASFATGLPEEGNIAFVTQSGALAVAVMDAAKKEGMKFSKIVSIGNKAVLDETEMLKYLATDEKTKVIGMYLEGIKNGKNFLETAAAVSKKKPVVILKAGKTQKTQEAILSHTGALAGSDQIISAVFEKTGVIRAKNLEEFFDLLNLISLTSAPKNEQAVIITNAGGPGVLATDVFENKGIVLSEVSQKTKVKLKKNLPEQSSVENPIDLLGDAKEDRYKKTFEIIDKDINPGSLILILTPQDQTPVLRIASRIINFKKKNGVDVVASFVGGERVAKAVKKLRENGVPNFNFPEQAVTALNKYYLWTKFFARGITRVEIHEDRKKRVGEILQKARNDGRAALHFSESSEIMKMYGINMVESYDVSVFDGEFPVVLKVDSDKVLHKTDKNGLMLDIKTREDLVKCKEKMQKSFPGERLIVQPMLARQVELIVGVKYDEIFGPALVFGLGGVYTEVFKMVDFLIVPLNLEEIKEKLAKSKIGFLFKETRGQAAYDLVEISNILWGVSQFALEAEGVKEFDINPLLIYNKQKESVAVDVKIII